MRDEDERALLRRTKGESSFSHPVDCINYRSQIEASIYTGKERYEKSKDGLGTEDEDADKEERERLNGFASWLVDGDE